MIKILFVFLATSGQYQVASSEEQIIPAHPNCTSDLNLNYDIESGLVCIGPGSAWTPEAPIFKNGFE